MALEPFHPAVSRWFADAFSSPTPAQAQAWPAIKAARHALVAAPTGSGKTLAAFLCAIDDLVRRGIAEGLRDETYVVYVSPLKALSNDIQRNLEHPLRGIREELSRLELPDAEIRVLVRTGDTPEAAREAMRRRPPHMVVTTPESLYILLTSESGRRMLATTRTVIVDEIHALAGSKRGLHLALSLERLEALTGPGLIRVGLSATQKPVAEVARFLVGAKNLRPDGSADCAIIDMGFARERDLALEVPSSPLTAVMANEVWEEVYDRLAQLIAEHRTTLIFTNTRRMAERLARHLSQRLGEDQVTSHHGSLAKELRLEAEGRLKRGELKALVATASLELGIDIGDVDLVCQLGSPRAIATFLQRVGRSGHGVGGTPKGRLFPLSRDDLVECAALLEAVARGELDRVRIPENALDVLAQQIVAEVACGEWQEEALFDLVRGAYPYRNLLREDYNAVVKMLSEGFSTRRGRRSAYLHRDAVYRRLTARRGARLAAIISGGTIPDSADYEVILEPEGQMIGTVNEDFAVESLAGDIFQLGNSSYRILRIEAGRVRVEDAQGLPPGIPFWLGEAPSRSDELSLAVSRLRENIASRLDEGGREAALAWLESAAGVAGPAAEQLVDYLASAKAALGLVPTHQDIVLERFFDETGGMQLVIHAPFGSRLNRAWGLALRKRFCRKFNFELQAAAGEDAIVLSLTTAHSFPLEEVARYLHSRSAREVLVQALLAAPMFTTRWRWNATTALALPRFRGGKKVPAPLQRMDAEDLLAAVFPDQLACAENLAGDREVPDHPLVNQTLRDCLFDAMDVEGLERLLARLSAGETRIHVRDLTSPSPLAQEILSARPYAFLDDAPLEERRTRAVMGRRWLDPEVAADLGRLDPEAIERVKREAWPEAESGDELHDALLTLGFLTPSEVALEPRWEALLAALAGQGRAALLSLPLSSSGERAKAGEGGLWVAAERLPELQALFPEAKLDPPRAAPAEFAQKRWTRGEALAAVLRSRLTGLGPVTRQALAEPLAVPVAEVEAALATLEAEGFALRGRFTGEGASEEWCERRLLSRIHRYTVKRLRQEIEPVAARDLLCFLFRWQRVLPEERGEGPDALAAVLSQMEGFEAKAPAWEAEILPARVNDYDPQWLDGLCQSGRVLWTRPAPKAREERGPALVKGAPIVLLPRRHAALWAALAGEPDPGAFPLSTRAQAVVQALSEGGASFFDELVEATGLLRTQVEEALGELVALGLASCDSFGGLRALLVPSERRKPLSGAKRRRRTALFGIEDAGRWALCRVRQDKESAAETVEHVARVLLKRYGVVFRRLLLREADWLPPWRDLWRAYRRLEARGEVRGGRFVAGFSGEQFASPEALPLLREARRREEPAPWISVSGADPLNLVGIVTPGARVAALAANRVLYRDGVPVALLAGGEVRFLEKLEPAAQWEAKAQLLKRPVPPLLRAYLG